MCDQALSLAERQLDQWNTLEQEQRQLLQEARQQYEQKLIRSADLICCTLSAAGMSLLRSRAGLAASERLFDTVLIDEAAQALEPESLIALQHDARRCILVGDPRQLPATVISGIAAHVRRKTNSVPGPKKGTASLPLITTTTTATRQERKAGKVASHSGVEILDLDKGAGTEERSSGRPDGDQLFAQSLFARLERSGAPVHRLEVQYRMHPEIRQLPSRLFYDNALKDSPRSPFPTLLLLPGVPFPSSVLHFHVYSGFFFRCSFRAGLRE